MSKSCCLGAGASLVMKRFGTGATRMSRSSDFYGAPRSIVNSSPHALTRGINSRDCQKSVSSLAEGTSSALMRGQQFNVTTPYEGIVLQPQQLGKVVDVPPCLQSLTGITELRSFVAFSTCSRRCGARQRSFVALLRSRFGNRPRGMRHRAPNACSASRLEELDLRSPGDGGETPPPIRSKVTYWLRNNPLTLVEEVVRGLSKCG